MGYFESIGMVAKELPENNCNFLVTGATGLIGSCVIDVLLYANKYCDANHKVYALGRSKKTLVERFGKGVIPIEQDITLPLMCNEKFDYIIHAASNADPISYSHRPVETVVTNVVGNINMLNYCKEHLETRMLLTSSFEVYGEVENTDIYREDMYGGINFHLLRNGYPESKRCAEILLKSYRDEYGVDGVIVRLSSIYGPTMKSNDSKAHAQFIYAGINNKSIVMKSKGEQKRTYCYVIDAVSALFTVLFKGESGEAYNIANENAIVSIAELAYTVAEITGQNVVYELPNEDEKRGYSVPHNCILDNSKLKSLGWRGRYSVQEGLAETISTLMSGK